MDKRPIGVFDSGIGGLTTVKQLTRCLPTEDIIYLGDTARVPYGSRSRETIIKYAKQDAQFLTKLDIKAMVVACNTVSSVAYNELKNTYKMPIFEVISTPSKIAADSTKNGKIGIIGTAATVSSGAYEVELKSISPRLQVFSKPCRLFVSLVEEGRTDADDIAALTIAEDYLAELRDEIGIDTLIMGCTHYPLLYDVISKVMGSEITLIDSGAETAKHVARELGTMNLLTNQASGTVKYYITDNIDGFSRLASRFLQSSVYGNVERVSIG